MNSIVANTLSAYTSALTTTSTSSAAAVAADTITTSTNEISMIDSDRSSETSTVQDTDLCHHTNTSSSSSKRLPFKKKLAVRWKDQLDRDNNDNTDTSGAEILKHQINNLKPEDDEIMIVEETKAVPRATPRRSPSPPLVNMKELQERIEKQELAIRRACKLELQLLNQAKHVREKRMRMVDRLQFMKRKVRRLVVINAHKNGTDVNDVLKMTATSNSNGVANIIADDEDKFVLPPVLGQKYKSTTVPIEKESSSSSPDYVDMTTEDVTTV
jgi:hypothetical protein